MENRAPRGFDPEQWTEFESAVRRCMECGPITWKQIHESGLSGKKYPYDRVAAELNALAGEDITELNVIRIIRSGWIESGRCAGLKTLAKMVKNPKTKELVLK